MASPCVDRLPLVVGVTGHRDLRDEDKPVLENAVAGVITQLRRDFLGLCAAKGAFSVNCWVLNAPKGARVPIATPPSRKRAPTL